MVAEAKIGAGYVPVTPKGGLQPFTQEVITTVLDGGTIYFKNSDRRVGEAVLIVEAKTKAGLTHVEVEGWRLKRVQSTGIEVRLSISWKDGEPHIKAFELTEPGQFVRLEPEHGKPFEVSHRR